jgi:hypothetical protein
LRALLSTAWHVVRHRAVADRTVLLAAAVTIVLATTLLAAGPQYAAAVAESGLRERLATEPGDDIGIEVSLRAESDRVADLDAVVTARLDATVGPWLERTELVAESDSLRGGALPDRHISALATAPMIEDEASLVAGDWPRSSASGPIPAVLQEDAATLLGLDVGDEATFRGRDEREIPVRVVGLYVPDDLDERIWWRSTFLTDGVVEGTGFTFVGPFVTDEAGFARLGDYRATMRWRSLPDAAAVTAPEIGTLRSRLSALEDTLGDLDSVGAVDLRSGLRDILTDAVVTLRSTQAAVIVTTIQLAVLALYALALAAGLLVDGRLVETELVRARGAEPRQLGTVAALEGLLLVVPAVLAAPLLASVVVRVLATTGVLAEVGLVLTPRLDAGSYVGAALAGLASVVVLTVPAVRSARTFTGTRAARGRTTRAPFAQRTGIDLALLVVAVLGLWQLRRLGGPVQDDAAGRAGIDPLLVAAPALGLLAGAVLTLRVVPLAGKLAERLVAGARSLVPVLGAWQLSRRPGRLARSVLLLVLAVAIGTFAATYGGTWSQSQEDQAGLAVGADLVVMPDTRSDAELPVAGLREAYAQVAGVEAVSPATVDRVPLPRNRGTAILMAVDSSTAAEVLTVREDLVSPTPEEAFRGLAAPLELTGVDVPGGSPSLITGRFRVTEVDGSIPGGEVGLQLVVQDATGLIHRLGPFDLPVTDSGSDVTVPLRSEVAGLDSGIIGPLRLLGVDFAVRPSALTLVSGEPGGPIPVFELVLSDLAIDGQPLALDVVDWFAPEPTVSSPPSAPADLQAMTVGRDRLTLRATSGQTLTGSGVTAFRLTPEQDRPTDAIPVLVTPAYLEALGADVGTEVLVRLSGASLPIRIVGTVDVVVGLPDEEFAMLADIATLATYRYRTDRDVTIPDQWMLAVADAQHEAIADRLGDAPFSSLSVIDRADVTRSLRTDPVAIGLIGALTLGFAAAAAFAAVGYLVSAVVGARERLGEFALLRALGTSHAETRRWLTLESGSTVLVSLGGGIALGLGLAWIILPSVSLARDGGVAIPTPVVVIPWVTITFVAAGAAAVLFAVPAVVTRMLGRTRVAEVLRLGDEG